MSTKKGGGMSTVSQREIYREKKLHIFEAWRTAAGLPSFKRKLYTRLANITLKKIGSGYRIVFFFLMCLVIIKLYVYSQLLLLQLMLICERLPYTFNASIC